ELFSSVDSKVEIWQRNRLKTVPQFIRTNQFRDIGFPDGEFFGSVTTLQEWSDMLGQCSLRHRFPVCSSGGYSNRKSFFWRLVGICVFPCRTETSRSCSPSEVCTPITSRCGVGSSGMPQKWNDVCALGSDRPTTVGEWTKPTSGSR